MAYCKDCLHYEVCSRTGTTASFPVDEGVCIPFAYRDRWAEVVRCKDCRFYEAGVEYYGGGTKDVCRLLTRQMQCDDFCSYGERKDGDS